MRDFISADVTELTDTELRALSNWLEAASTRAASLNGRPRAALADLAQSARAVLSYRVLHWHSISADPAVPPDWDTAVAALEPEEE